MSTKVFYIKDWKVDITLHRIIHSNGTIRRVEPQLMAVLVYLAKNEGELVSKEELMEEVWKDVVVTDNVLTRAISSLRKVLGDDPRNPTFIETISKTGYRLIAKVKESSKDSVSEDKVHLTIRRRPLVIGISLIVLIVFGAFSILDVFSPPEVAVYHPKALANSDMTEYYPAISRDGNFVAYTYRSPEKNWDVYVKRIGTENQIRLTNDASVEMRPVWSADGANIYFMRYEPSGATIYRAPMTGGKETRILTTPKYTKGNFDISPDNTELAFNSRPHKNSPLQVELTDLDSGVKKIMTSPPANFNGDLHPTYSPDGTKIGFIREKNSVSMYLYVLDLITGDTQQITTEHLSINGFDWSSDGNSLIYGTDKTGIYKLWKVNLKDLKSTLMPVADYQMVMPRVGGNGQMVYAKLQDNVNIWRYSLKTKEGKVWRASNVLDLNPSYSPNGNKVVFTTNQSGSFQLWTSNMDGGEAISISTFKGQYINTPRWSSDGQTILFQGYQNGKSDIYSIDALGGIPKNLTNSSEDTHTPFFSSDGTYIYYSVSTNGIWNVWRMTAAGGDRTQITNAGGYAPQLLLDMTTLFYVKKEEKGLWSMKLDTKKEQLVTIDFDSKKYGAFTLSSKGVYYLNSKTRTIDYLDFFSQENTSLFRPKRIPSFGITLHYNTMKQELLYAQVDDIDADIMLLEKK
ncbi:winged helix-turn-helix domain-containing protein [Flavobacteriaceae bacterium S356]|uniref:Winged helix-turn-helix domain-containing protein n=1 Tax=Asprobacillus argus TaxID=3076534 RepID=A0ABU3LDH1_9FLAO|nr:winged helix-turn-helix domain-containing protein [Flavobacteriaceae bacterium S356]